MDGSGQVGPSRAGRCKVWAGSGSRLLVLIEFEPSKLSSLELVPGRPYLPATCRVYRAARSCLRDWSSVASRRAFGFGAASPAGFGLRLLDGQGLTQFRALQDLGFRVCRIPNQDPQNQTLKIPKPPECPYTIGSLGPCFLGAPQHGRHRHFPKGPSFYIPLFVAAISAVG